MKFGTFKSVNWDNVGLLVWINLGWGIPFAICLKVLGVIG